MTDFKAHINSVHVDNICKKRMQQQIIQTRIETIKYQKYVFLWRQSDIYSTTSNGKSLSLLIKYAELAHSYLTVNFLLPASHGN